MADDGAMGLGTSLFRLHQVEIGQDVVAVRETGIRLGFFKAGGGGIAPAALAQERVPDLDLLSIRLAAMGETPAEDFLVAPPFHDSCGELVEIDAEKFTQPVVEGAVSRNDSDVVAIRKFPGGVEPDLVEDSAENDDAAGLIARAADGEAHDFWFGWPKDLPEANGRVDPVATVDLKRRNAAAGHD